MTFGECEQAAVLNWLSGDADALSSLSSGKKDLFANRVRQACCTRGVDFGSLTDDQIFRKVLSWNHGPLRQAQIAQAAALWRQLRACNRSAKLHFITQTRLHLSADDRAEILAAVSVRRVEPLLKPYPPYQCIISETSVIYSKWYHHFAHGKQADARLPRLPIHKLDQSKLAIDVGPEESIMLRDDSDALIGFVLRNFCPNKAAVAWADAAAAKQMPYRRNIRKEDTGKLVQMGYSAGKRSSSQFHWVHNLTTKKLSEEAVNESNKEASSLFAFAWQLMRSQLPPEVIADFDDFVSGTNLRRMDADGKMSGLLSCEQQELDSKKAQTKGQRKHTLKSGNNQACGTYSVTVGGNQFDFHHVELAPPAGVVGQNYSRAIHYEAQPHTYGASWTISRTPGFHGGHFYFAKYGARIQQAANTLIIWRPSEDHGTSLPDVDPLDFNPNFCQRGLAFVTSNRLATSWQKFQEGIVSRDEALEEAKNSNNENDEA